MFGVASSQLGTMNSALDKIGGTQGTSLPDFSEPSWVLPPGLFRTLLGPSKNEQFTKFSRLLRVEHNCTLSLLGVDAVMLIYSGVKTEKIDKGRIWVGFRPIRRVFLEILPLHKAKEKQKKQPKIKKSL